jgi:hypothetical protein
MINACIVALLLVAVTTPARAQQHPEYYAHPLQLADREAWHEKEFPPDSEHGEVPSLKVLEFVGKKLRPLLAAVPTESGPKGKRKLPGFAVVAGADGRTVVSLTRPGNRANSDGILFHRLLVSNVLRGKRFSLSVYKDHALHEDALRFLGVGTRLNFRPKLKIGGWEMRLQVFGSFHPTYGGTGYFAISGRAPERTLPPPPLLSSQAAGDSSEPALRQLADEVDDFRHDQRVFEESRARFRAR